jgi:hypothetical protein
MSGRCVSRVLESALAPDLKFTAVVFASFAEDDGTQIFPSVGLVAHLRGLQERAVQYHVRDLRRMAILEVIRPATQWQAAHYRIVLENLPVRAPYRPPDRQRSLLGPGEGLGGESPPGHPLGVQPVAPQSGVQPNVPGVQPSVPGVQPVAPDPSVRSVSTIRQYTHVPPDAREAAAEAGERSPGESANLPLVGSTPRDTDHDAHAWCGRICVPKFLHRSFKKALGGPVKCRPKRMRVFYAETLDAIPAATPIGDEPVKFWRSAFAARFGRAAPMRVEARRGAAPLPTPDYDAPEAVARRRRQADAEAWQEAQECEAGAVIDAMTPGPLAALRVTAVSELASFRANLTPAHYEASVRKVMIRLVVEAHSRDRKSG